jgi:hypothetical protein
VTTAMPMPYGENIYVQCHRAASPYLEPFSSYTTFSGLGAIYPPGSGIRVKGLGLSHHAETFVYDHQGHAGFSFLAVMSITTHALETMVTV